MKSFNKKVYMTTNTLETRNQTIRLFTYFYRPDSVEKIKAQDVVAQSYLMTTKESYSFVLRRRSINKQLTWNSDLISKVQTSFTPKSNYIIMTIQDGQYGSKHLNVAMEIQDRLIRVLLFEVQLSSLNQKPYLLMKSLMNKQNEENILSLYALKERQKKQKERINQFQQLYIQINQNYKDEILLYKERFIPVINQCKKKLNKCFGFKNNDQTQETVETNQQYSKRQFMKIKRDKQDKLKDNYKGIQVFDLFG